MRSSLVIRSEGMGGQATARVLGILSERERLPIYWVSGAMIFGWRSCSVGADLSDTELALDAESMRGAVESKSTGMVPKQC